MDMQLLSPLITPSHTFRNRLVMAPMNRRRAESGIPGDSMRTYYSQRSGAGLILTDNTGIAPNAFGYLNTPGIYNSAQQEGWKKIIDEVHRKGGKIFVQLVHAGRIGHPANHEGGLPIVGASNIKANDTLRTPGDVYLPMPEPQVLTTAETQALVALHVQAAVKAVEIGFDGVEIHGAHGFLTEQFLHPATNNRTDQYGGDIVNRSRFLLEIMEGVSRAIGKERTGVRLSPFAVVNDLPLYEEEAATHQYLVDELAKLDILFIHLSNQHIDGISSIPTTFLEDVRKRFNNLLIFTGGNTRESAEALLQAGLIDLAGFGRDFISNPDLAAHFRYNIPLTPADETTFYHGGDKGYIDYAAHPDIHVYADTEA